MTIDVDGLRVQGPFDSRGMLCQIATGRYEPLATELFKGAISPGMTVLDIGANIGFYSLLASRAVGDTGAVYAFEADPRNVGHLEANASANACTNIKVLHAAVAAGPGVHTFLMAARPTDSSLFKSMGDMPVVPTEVATIAIDDVLADRWTVDVVKMDIEGGEPAALRGMAATLRASPNLRMFVEFEPPALEAAGESPEEFLGHLQLIFEDVSLIDEGQCRLVPLSDGKLGLTQNLLCSGVRSA